MVDLGVDSDSIAYAQKYLKNVCHMIDSYAKQSNFLSGLLKELGKFEHAGGVVLVASIVARNAGIETEKGLQTLGLASFLHDVGLIYKSDDDDMYKDNEEKYYDEGQIVQKLESKKIYGDDHWRRGNRGGETRRDRDQGRRNPRGPIVDRDRPRNPRGPRGPVVDHRPPRRDRDVRDHRDYRDLDHRRWRDDNHRRFRHRPHWREPHRRYTRHTHRPHRDRFDHRRRFNRRYDYHRTIPYRFVYWDNWIRYRVSHNDGFVIIDGYPYYVYNGYRHRYSSYDRCDYDLVDGWDNRVERTFTVILVSRTTIIAPIFAMISIGEEVTIATFALRESTIHTEVTVIGTTMMTSTMMSTSKIRYL